MHTQFDYYARYMFFVHRGQHLVLHHLGAFLIALANPLPVFAACAGDAASRAWRRRSGRCAGCCSIRWWPRCCSWA